MRFAYNGDAVNIHIITTTHIKCKIFHIAQTACGNPGVAANA